MLDDLVLLGLLEGAAVFSAPQAANRSCLAALLEERGTERGGRSRIGLEFEGKCAARARSKGGALAASKGAVPAGRQSASIDDRVRPTEVHPAHAVSKTVSKVIRRMKLDR